MTSCWNSLSVVERERICREYGFGDFRVYARYLWEDFTESSRVRLWYQFPEVRHTRLLDSECAR